MAHVGFDCDALPVATSGFQKRADFGVKVSAHSHIIAKLCDRGKQHFASPYSDTDGVHPKPINLVLAEALRFFMGKSWNNSSLAKASGVAEGTIRNYLSPTKRESGKTGKEPSAKLTELAKLAAALGVQVADLVTEATDAERQQLHRKRAAEHYVRTGKFPHWAPSDEGAESQPDSGPGKRTGTAG